MNIDNLGNDESIFEGKEDNAFECLQSLVDAHPPEFNKEIYEKFFDNYGNFYNSYIINTYYKSLYQKPHFPVRFPCSFEIAPDNPDVSQLYKTQQSDEIPNFSRNIGIYETNDVLNGSRGDGNVLIQELKEVFNDLKKQNNLANDKLFILENISHLTKEMESKHAFEKIPRDTIKRVLKRIVTDFNLIITKIVTVAVNRHSVPEDEKNKTKKYHKELVSSLKKADNFDIKRFEESEFARKENEGNEEENKDANDREIRQRREDLANWEMNKNIELLAGASDFASNEGNGAAKIIVNKLDVIEGLMAYCNELDCYSTKSIIYGLMSKYQ